MSARKPLVVNAGGVQQLQSTDTLQLTGLTTGRIPFVSADTTLIDSASLAFDGTNLSIAGCAPLTVIASNTTLYVATTGSDSTGDGTSEHPWATLAKAMSYLQAFSISGSVTVTISIAAGVYASSSALNLNHVNGGQIQILGPYYHATNTISSIVSTSGAAYGWTIVLQLNNVTNLNAGDYVSIEALSGGTNPHFVAGIHRLDSVDAENSRITILTTHSCATPPSGNVTGSVRRYKTVLSFTGCHGLTLSNQHTFLRVDGLAIVGDRTSGKHGLYVHDQGDLTLGTAVGVNGFTRAVYCAYQSFILATYCNFTNNSDGVRAEYQSAIVAMQAQITCNNAGMYSGQGVTVTYNSFAEVGGALITGNDYAGVCADSQSCVDAPSAKINGQTYGGLITYNSLLRVGNGAIGNCGTGLLAAYSSHILGGGATFTGNATNSSPAANTEGNTLSYITV